MFGFAQRNQREKEKLAKQKQGLSFSFMPENYFFFLLLPMTSGNGLEEEKSCDAMFLYKREGIKTST